MTVSFSFYSFKGNLMICHMSFAWVYGGQLLFVVCKIRRVIAMNKLCFVGSSRSTWFSSLFVLGGSDLVCVFF